MKDNLYSVSEARAGLIRGVDKIADAVKGTLGAAGYNYVSEKFEYPYYVVSNDGVSLAKDIELADPLERLGASMVKEVATKADKQGGDGTTTAVTLIQAIIRGGVGSTEHPMVLKKSLEECLPIIEECIKSQTKEITVDEVGKVAAISAEDEKIGALIQEIYQKIGKDGILYPDVSKTFEDHYTLGNGVKVEGAGLASPYMADFNENMQPLNAAVIKNASVLVTKQKITNARRDLETIIGQLSGKQIRDLVIFADDMEPTVIPDLVSTRIKNGFRTVIVKLPTVWKDQWFEDIARLTKATIIDPVAGINFQSMKVGHLGTIGSFLADKNDTFLDGTEDISAYIAELNADGTDESKIRAARLNTMTARLFVGASSDAALSYKRLKVEDARNAAYQALHGGVVAGGGVTLLNAARLLENQVASVGSTILGEALRAPIMQIMLNAGVKEQEARNKIAESSMDSSSQFIGFDARTGKTGDMFTLGIIDPAQVVLGSVRNAISVAATVLTARVAVTIPRREEHEPEQMPSMAVN